MTVSITLPEEVERALRSRAAAAGQDGESFVRQVVTESLVYENETTPAGRASPSDFRMRLESWIALHPVLDHAVDDSRESIYGGRD